MHAKIGGKNFAFLFANGDLIDSQSAFVVANVQTSPVSHWLCAIGGTIGAAVVRVAPSRSIAAAVPYDDGATTRDPDGDSSGDRAWYGSWHNPTLDSWRSIDHRVPTRRGLQDERIWLNYPRPTKLHDCRYAGDDRRSRERIRRRQRNWVSQLAAMCDRERDAMMESLRKQARRPV